MIIRFRALVPKPSSSRYPNSGERYHGNREFYQEYESGGGKVVFVGVLLSLGACDLKNASTSALDEHSLSAKVVDPSKLFESPYGGVEVLFDTICREEPSFAGMLLKDSGSLVPGTSTHIWILCNDISDIYSSYGDSGAPIFKWYGNDSYVYFAGILWGGPGLNPYETWHSPFNNIIKGLSFTSYYTF